MKHSIIAIIAALLLSTSHAQPSAPATVQAVEGVGVIGWSNDVGADTVIVLLDRSDCAVPTLAEVSKDAQQVVQVPTATDARCLLRGGDHLTLVRYRGGQYIDTLGPYIVPAVVYMPLVGRDVCLDWQTANCG